MITFNLNVQLYSKTIINIILIYYIWRLLPFFDVEFPQKSTKIKSKMIEF